MSSDIITILIVVIVVFSWIFQAIKKMNEVRGPARPNASLDADDEATGREFSSRDRSRMGDPLAEERTEREQARILYQQRVEALRRAAARQQASSSTGQSTPLTGQTRSTPRAQRTAAPPPPPPPPTTSRTTTPPQRRPTASTSRTRAADPTPVRRRPPEAAKTRTRASVSDFKSFSSMERRSQSLVDKMTEAGLSEDPFTMPSIPSLAALPRLASHGQTTVPGGSGTGAISIGEDREALRRAWLMKEVLDAPRAMRPLTFGYEG
ncbi:MAG: hypothetical protein JJU36_10495 [Phycisphaeraceae bacterium]|nr:hypothetical protein [Phycisphaeraceae bacterium]